MRRVMVRYRVKPDQVAENEQLVRDVYEELSRTQPDGFRYGTFKLEDGVSFVHLAVAGGRAEPACRGGGVPALPGGHPRPLRRAAGRGRAGRGGLLPLPRGRVMAGAGTREDPWQLKTPPLTSDYEMYLDERDGTKVIVCVVGKTTLLYDARAIDDLHAMLVGHGDWIELGSADEQKPAKDGTVEAWGRVAGQPARRLVRAQEGAARPVRDVHAAAARGARARRGRAQPAQQPDAGEVRPRPGLPGRGPLRLDRLRGQLSELGANALRAPVVLGDLVRRESPELEQSPDEHQALQLERQIIEPLPRGSSCCLQLRHEHRLGGLLGLRLEHHRCEQRARPRPFRPGRRRRSGSRASAPRR